jgi:hypothetical protein
MFFDHISDLVDDLVQKDGDDGLIAARAIEGRHPVWKFRWMG